MSIPYIDETVEHVGVSKLRTLNASTLRNSDKTLVIQENDKPLAVLLSYEHFLMMQRQLRSVVNTLELLSGQDELAKYFKGLDDLKEGKEKPLEQIDQELAEAS